MTFVCFLLTCACGAFSKGQVSKDILVFYLLLDSELCLKTLKEASFFFFLLLAWKHEQKLFQMEQKMFTKKFVPNWTKKVKKGTK